MLGVRLLRQSSHELCVAEVELDAEIQHMQVNMYMHVIYVCLYVYINIYLG